MSLHRSLKVTVSSKGHRNVLKRFERIKKLQAEDRWSEEDGKVFGLPKVKSMKIKAKAKTKAAPDKDQK